MELVKGTQPKYVHALFEKYGKHDFDGGLPCRTALGKSSIHPADFQSSGPVVRVGPNEVCFCDVAALKQIYNINETFAKSSLCDVVVKSPAPNVFSTTEAEVHRRHRKLLEPGLSEGAVAQMYSSVNAKVELAIQRMREETKNEGASDIYKWWTLLAADVAGELTFGQSFGILEAGEVSFLPRGNRLIPKPHAPLSRYKQASLLFRIL